MPSNGILKELRLDGSCNFDSARSIELLAQVIDKCHALTLLHLQGQIGARKVVASFKPFKKGFFFDDKAMIEVRDAADNKKLLSIQATARTEPIDIQNWDDSKTRFWICQIILDEMKKAS